MPKPRGRPFDRSRDAAIHAATLELLAEHGYERLTMDMVVARAKAGKGALYRRWSSKSELVASAIASLDEHVACPDTGSLKADLEAFLAMTEGSVDYAFEVNLMAGVAAAARHSPELAQAVGGGFVRPRLEVLLQILGRAAARGEVPGERDLELLVQVVPGLLLLRAVTSGGPPGPEFLRRAVMEVLYPLAVAREAPATHPTVGTT